MRTRVSRGQRYLKLFVVAVWTALVLAAFARGNHVLGVGYGIGFAVVIGGVLYVVARAALESERHRMALPLSVVVVLLVAPMALILSFPAWVSPDMRHFVEKQRIDRSVRSELRAVFSSDSRFADLGVSTMQLKCVNVTIRGTVAKKGDLQLLRSRVFDQCDHLSLCILHWDVRDRETGAMVEGLDSELFGDDREVDTPQRTRGNESD